MDFGHFLLYIILKTTYYPEMKRAELCLSQPEVKFQQFKVWLPGIRRFHSSCAERQQHTNCLKVSFLLLHLFNFLRVERK